MISESVPEYSVNNIYTIFRKQQYDTICQSNRNVDNRLYLELVKSYSEYLYKKGELDKNNLIEVNDQLSHCYMQNPNQNYYFDLSSYKSPAKTFDDTQFAMGYKYIDDTHYMKLNFLPASHIITDDNREYFNESVLKVADISLLVDQYSIKLDSFTLLSTRSLLPYNTLVGGLSGEFTIGIEDHFDTNLQPEKAGTISAGLGLTEKISTDINSYILVNFGMAYGDSKPYAYIFPEIGATIYELFNMKTYANYKYIYNQLNSHEAYHSCRLTQSLFPNKAYKLTATYEYLFNKSVSESNYEMMFSVYF